MLSHCRWVDLEAALFPSQGYIIQPKFATLAGYKVDSRTISPTAQYVLTRQKVNPAADHITSVHLGPIDPVKHTIIETGANPSRKQLAHWRCTCFGQLGAEDGHLDLGLSSISPL